MNIEFWLLLSLTALSLIVAIAPAIWIDGYLARRKPNVLDMFMNLLITLVLIYVALIMSGWMRG